MARAARPASLLLPLLLAAAGCETQQTASLDDAVRAYDAKRYAESLRIAKEVQSGSQDTGVRQQAAYVAGQSATELNKRDEARDSFAIAARSADPVVAGRALAGQAALAVEDKRWSDAAGAYAAAAAKLTGGEAELARAQGLKAAAKADEQRRASVARPPVAPAPAPAPVPAPAPAPAPAGGTAPTANATDDGDADAPSARGGLLPPPPESAPWTIAAGAFGTETAARQRATNLSKEAKRAGLPTPRVFAIASPDRKVWIVEIGSFDDRSKADAARKKISVGDAAVAHSRAPKSK